MTWVIVCLGSMPRVFGPFASELEADDWLEDHHATPTKEDPVGFCFNGIGAEDHHVLEMGL